jgi:hypothetical protein
LPAHRIDIYHPSSQLIICAGAIYASKSGHLKLDRAIVTREVGFYALSIVGLLYALHDKKPADDGGSDYIYIQFSDAAVLAGAYVLYVLVCAYFEPILDFLAKKRNRPQRGFGADYGAIKRSTVRPRIICRACCVLSSQIAPLVCYGIGCNDERPGYALHAQVFPS